jgi:hypothetical protein
MGFDKDDERKQLGYYTHIAFYHNTIPDYKRGQTDLELRSSAELDALTNK